MLMTQYPWTNIILEHIINLKEGCEIFSVFVNY